MSIKHQSDVMLDGTVTFTGAPTSITATLYTASASSTSFTSSATMVTVGTPYGYNVDLICVVSSQADKTRVKIAATATVNGVSETQWTTVRVIDASVTSRLASSTGLISLGFDYNGSGYINANAIRLGGISVTGRDIGASVLISPGTGTGQLDVTAGVVKSNMVQIIASAITETTPGWIAAAFRKYFNVASPVHTMASVDQTGDGYGVLSNGVSLTSAERDTLAGVIDARLLSAGDATDLIAGIVSRIGNTNVDQAAFVVAVKAALFDAGSIANKLAVNGAGAVTFANTSIGSVTGSVGSVTQGVTLATAADNKLDDIAATVGALPDANTIAGATQDVLLAEDSPLITGSLAAQSADEKAVAIINKIGNLSGDDGDDVGTLLKGTKTIALAIEEKLPSGNQLIAGADDLANVGGSNGDGTVLVNQDYGGVDHYRVQNADGSWAANATIRAYVKTDYDAGNFPPQPPRTRTLDTPPNVGRWPSGLMLNPGTYYLHIFNPADGLTKLFSLTVVAP